MSSRNVVKVGGALAIEATGLVKTYVDLRAVDEVDLSVPQGTVFALLGPNGAGKTTTVEIGSRPLLSSEAGQLKNRYIDLSQRERCSEKKDAKQLKLDRA